MTKPRLAADYDDDITAASRSALAEVMTTLGAYRDALVLIGGWAPYLILERFGESGAFQGDAFQADAFQASPVHVGSIDIDLVVDPDVVDAEQYATIVERLLERGWAPAPESRFQFQKETASPRSGRPHLIRIDFLTPKPLRGQGRARRHRAVQGDLDARTLEGAEVALGHWFWYEIEAPLADGAVARVALKVADVVGMLALKGFAIGERYAEKDAYDIYMLCAHHAGGPRPVADRLRPARDEAPVRRGLAAIAEKFRAQDAEGPTWVARFFSPAGEDEFERLRLDALMTIQEVLRLTG